MKNFEYKALLFVAICAVVIGYPFFTIKYFETHLAIIIVWKYFLLPIFIILTIVCPVFYFKKMKSLDKRQVSKIKQRLKDFISICMIILFITLLLFSAAFSLVITTNKWFGNSELVMIKEPVIKYHPYTTKHGKLIHYINFVNPKSKDTIINFQVFRNYKKGEIFEKEMKCGAWGILYSTE